MNIRKSVAEDWKDIQRLNTQVFESDAPHDSDLDLGWPLSPQAIEYYKKVAAGMYGCCLIAEQDNISVGYIIIIDKNTDYRKSLSMEIDNMGVSPEYRSQGIGKELMNSAIGYAKEKGVKKLILSAYSKNTRAIDFYKSLGFHEISIELERDVA